MKQGLSTNPETRKGRACNSSGHIGVLEAKEVGMTDEQAFGDFVRHRSAALYRYGYVLAATHHDADDLVQEALIRLRGHWSRVARGGSDPVGYVRTTMARLHVSA